MKCECGVSSQQRLKQYPAYLDSRRDNGVSMLSYVVSNEHRSAKYQITQVEHTKAHSKMDLICQNEIINTQTNTK